MEGAYGGRIALPVWNDIMTGAESIGYEFTDFAEPEEVISMELCRESGLLAGEGSARPHSEEVLQNSALIAFFSGSLRVRI